jgi:NADH-quinone oxidoreductase subunit N
MLIRFFGGALPTTLLAKGALLDASPWPLILGATAAVTMTLGNLSALGQQNIKRMFAYSSIAHAGYLLLGMVALQGSGSRSILFYLVTYLFMNLGAFLVVIALAEAGVGERVDDYKGLGVRNPFIAVVLAVFLFSLTGLPPFAGFAGKFLVFSALLEHPTSMNVFLAILGVVNSAISLYYYARLAKVMFFDKPAENAAPVKIHGLHATTLTALAIPTIFLGIYWTPLLDLADRAMRVAGPHVVHTARAALALL